MNSVRITSCSHKCYLLSLSYMCSCTDKKLWSMQISCIQSTTMINHNIITRWWTKCRNYHITIIRRIYSITRNASVKCTDINSLMRRASALCITIRWGYPCWLCRPLELSTIIFYNIGTSTILLGLNLCLYLGNIFVLSLYISFYLSFIILLLLLILL